ncbi:MAG: hypothetical protein HC897_19765 [Thermoanaerobaculia bacterium]|nr:hypothetical protein [Thermoanaerobaculia bacterium]
MSKIATFAPAFASASALALPEASAAERRRIGAQAARNFGRTVCEFLRFSGDDRERVLELVMIEGLDTLRAALAEGRGAVLVTAHLARGRSTSPRWPPRGCRRLCSWACNATLKSTS